MAGYLSVTPVDQRRRSLGVRLYSAWHLDLVRARCISQESQVSFEFAFKTKTNLF